MPDGLPTFPRHAARDWSGLADFLAEYLGSVCAPVARSDYDRSLMHSALGVARSIELFRQIGDVPEQDDLDDMEVVLGHQPRNRKVGTTRSQNLVEQPPAEARKILFGCFPARNGGDNTFGRR